MPSTDPEQKPRSNAWQTALTMLQEAEPLFIPAGAHAMTLVVEFPPGDPGTPPHRHTGPAFGYVLEGEMLLELEGEAERVVRAGEAFWEPRGRRHSLPGRKQPRRHSPPLHGDDAV
jgi:quercetin dioxygenase-like cupin family protein